MTDPKPFQIRRLLSEGGGDQSRGSSDAPTAPSYLRYGTVLPTEFTGYMTARAVDYDRIEVGWGVLAGSTFPSTDLRYVALVRSGFGYPDHPGDGTVLMLTSSLADTPPSFTDGNLTAGRWYYYTLMAQYGTEEQSRWTNVYRAAALAPVDYGHRNHLFNLLPPFYQQQDDNTWAGTPNSVLRRFFEVVGYDLDLTRTMAEGVQELWNPDTGPMQLIRRLGEQNLGLDHNAVLADTRFRGLVSDFRQINDLRGTVEGLRRFVTAASKYRTEVTTGSNLLLTVDDAEFETGTGHWAPAPASITSELAADGLPRVTDGVKITKNDGLRLSDGSWLHIATLPGTDRDEHLNRIMPFPLPSNGNGVVMPGGPDPYTLDDFVSIDPVLPPSGPGMPSWVRGLARIEAAAGNEMIVACGAGQRIALVSKDADGRPVTEVQHMDPSMHGVPVDAGSSYHVSLYLCRPNGSEDLYVSLGAAVFGVPPFERLGLSDGFSSGFSGFVRYAEGTDDPAFDAPVVMSNDFVPTVRRPSYVGTVLLPETLDAADGDWHLYEVEVPVPENARYLVPVLRVSTTLDPDHDVDGGPPSEPVYITAAMVTESETPTLTDIYTPGTTMVVGRDLLQPPTGTIYIGG